MNFRSVPAHPIGRARLGRAAGTRLSGSWLILTRVVWIVLVVCILGYFIASLPQTFVTLHQPCTGVWCTNATGRLTTSQMQSLAQAGTSLDAYAWFWLVFNGVMALVWFGVAGILFWHKSDDWMVLLVALMLISVGADNVTNTLLYSSSFWRFPEHGLYLIVSQTILYTLALFPNGRFVPRWSRWVTLVYPAYIVCYLLFLRPLRIWLGAVLHSDQRRRLVRQLYRPDAGATLPLLPGVQRGGAPANQVGGSRLLCTPGGRSGRSQPGRPPVRPTQRLTLRAH